MCECLLALISLANLFSATLVYVQRRLHATQLRPTPSPRPPNRSVDGNYVHVPIVYVAPSIWNVALLHFLNSFKLNGVAAPAPVATDGSAGGAGAGGADGCAAFADVGGGVGVSLADNGVVDLDLLAEDMVRECRCSTVCVGIFLCVLLRPGPAMRLLNQHHGIPKTL